jgi:hypothetical protein
MKFEDYPDFKPDLTPKQMFEYGILGGSYFRNIKSHITNKTYKSSDIKKFKFLKNIDKNKLISQSYNKEINKFKVKAGSSYYEWLEKGWIDETNAPRGWIEWYCHFYNGRRSNDDKRQIKRWKNFASIKSGRFRIMFQNTINKLKYNNLTVRPVIQQNLLEWGVDSTKMKPKIT